MCNVDEFSSLLRTGGQKIYFHEVPQTVSTGTSFKVMVTARHEIGSLIAGECNSGTKPSI